MTDIDLDKLEALADAATPGPEEHWTGGDWSLWVQFLEFYDYAPASAIALLKAIDPATILDLIASAREDAAEIERLREALNPEPAWILEQATSLSSDKDADAIGALAWNLTVFLRRLENRAAQMDGEG